MRLFWQKGYEGTSLSDLTDAIGVNRPSLYAAFGNKEELFRKVLDRYVELQGEEMGTALSLPTAREVAGALLHNAAKFLSRPESPGCMIVQGALACSDKSEMVRHELCAKREANVDMLSLRFEKAKIDGELPDTVNAPDLARYVVTVLNGMSVQAATGANEQDLLKVAELAMRAWPR